MIRLKSLTLPSPVIQSPMAGCTDLAFRLIARSFGMKFAFLEMVSADSLVRNNDKTLGLLKSAPQDRPLGAQLVGCNPDTMGEAAAMIEDMGFDLLDINMGCPVPKIVSPGGGSALLIEPEKARSIFGAVIKKVRRIPVTVKMRKGFSDPSGDEAVRIARLAEESGLAAVTVHGRTRVQGYSGPADWRAIGKVKQAVKIPVFGNGDVLTGEDAARLVSETGCDGVMIGRGALGNPWIYGAIESALAANSGDTHLNSAELRCVSPEFEERKAVLLRHLGLQIETEGEKLAVLNMRRVACWYFKTVPGAAEFRNRVCRCETTAQMREIIEQFDPRRSLPPTSIGGGDDVTT